VAWSMPGSNSVTVGNSSNRGKSWRQQSLPAFQEPMASPTSLQFLDTAHGWLSVTTSTGHLSRGMLFTTTNQGTNWIAHQMPFAGPVAFHTALTGWGVGGTDATLQNHLMLTTDGGQSWTEQPLALPSDAEAVAPFIALPVFSSEQTGFVSVAAGAALHLYTTQDAGKTWAETAAFPTESTDTLAPPVTATVGNTSWVEVGHTLVVTHDGGASWTTLAHNAVASNARILGFRDALHGWAVVTEGNCKSFKSDCSMTTRVYHTTDGGQNWTDAIVQ
jgi:photosystem II stability/assembly factor-like uncharacterized protein